MILIGLTGGVATGKSTVAKMFRGLGIQTLSADEIAHKVIKKGRPEHKKVLDACGRTILRKDGEINRARLGELIFGDLPRWRRLRKKVEKIIHPAVWCEIKNVVAKLALRKNFIVIEVPLLFEVGWEKRFDKVITVISSRRRQVERCKKGFERRMDAQMPLKDKAKRADFVIDNSGSLANTRKQVKEIYEHLI